MSTRREFISQAAIAAGVSGIEITGAADNKARSTTRSLSVLLLGATGYIGPHFVRAALDRGHRVSVFTRGKSEVNLPASVERLVGDRNNDLRAIENRSWDAVIDLATYGPMWVRTLGEAVKQHARHYTFISTIDVYKHRSSNPNGTDEGSETFEYNFDLDPYSHSSDEINAAAFNEYCGRNSSPKVCSEKADLYGPLKVLCEKEAEKQFPGRTLIVRPGYMVGPGDPQGRFTYWLARLEKGGEVLAPGDPLQPVQFIDVRDVAEWVIAMAERAEAGTYNALGPGRSMSVCEMLGGIRSLFGVPMKLTWVSIPWIGNQDIVDAEAAEWSIWRFSRDDACRSDRAVSKGLRYRPLSLTAKDTLDWFKNQAPARQLIVQTGKEGGTPLSEVMQREKEILGRWRIHQSRI